jgi:hypothetical protein
MTTRREKIVAQDRILEAIEAVAKVEQSAGRDAIAAAVRAELERLSAKYGVGK